MNNDFQEKLHLYKEGQLNSEETTEIEQEIEKFNALWDYLNDEDKSFIEELKQQLPADHREEPKYAQRLKRRVNLRIIMITIASVFSILSAIVFFYFMASSIASGLFGLDYKEMYVKRATVVQLLQTLHPPYQSHRSGTEKSLFAQQNIRVSLDNTVGNTLINEREISVRYSFGRPVLSNTPAELPPLLSVHDLALLTSHEADSRSGFEVLEKAPPGTKVQILVEFNKALTPEQLKESFVSLIGGSDTTPLQVTPMTAVGSEFVLANPSYFSFTPAFPYDNNNPQQAEDIRLKQELYSNMDNEAHKESLIGNLTLIRNNTKLLQALYNAPLFQQIDMEDAIHQVESNGVGYVGMYLSASREELLKLKDHPLIHCMRVQNIVIW